MRAERIFGAMFWLYLMVFAAYLFAPLIIMGAASFNESRFPTVIPNSSWTAFTTVDGPSKQARDWTMKVRISVFSLAPAIAQSPLTPAGMSRSIVRCW